MVYSFETQLSAVKDRLEAAKIGTRNLGGMNGLAPSQGAPSGGGGFGSRIAKPLRGGGGPMGGADGSGSAPIVPTFAGLQAQADALGKKGSWFFNQRT